MHVVIDNVPLMFIAASSVSGTTYRASSRVRNREKGMTKRQSKEAHLQRHHLNGGREAISRTLICDIVSRSAKYVK